MQTEHRLKSKASRHNQSLPSCGISKVVRLSSAICRPPLISMICNASCFNMDQLTVWSSTKMWKRLMCVHMSYTRRNGMSNVSCEQLIQCGRYLVQTSGVCDYWWYRQDRRIRWSQTVDSGKDRSAKIRSDDQKQRHSICTSPSCRCDDHQRTLHICACVRRNHVWNGSDGLQDDMDQRARKTTIIHIDG